jgi:NADH-quinone oxidoreductase subunit M
LDSLSSILILLTFLLIPICILCSWSTIFYKIKFFLSLLFIIEFILVNLFLTYNLFIFYIFFEGLLLPMFLLIGIWGTRKRKIYATYLFFFYTFIGSLLMLVVLFLLYANVGSLNYNVLLELNYPNNKAYFCGLLLFLSFSIKVPSFPFHLWLPEAHVEAPTVGSILLAGIILKLSLYAYLRFLIPLFADIIFFLSIYIQLIGFLSIFFASLLILRQIDLKKIIAYSSIIHMNYAVCSIFCLNIYGIAGSVLFTLSHGFISSALFFLIGCVYDRYGTRNIKLLRGLLIYMPFYSLFFFIYNLANMSFPGCISFVSELLILLGVCYANKALAFFLLFFILFTGIYSV